MILDLLSIPASKMLVPDHHLQTGLFYTMGATFNEGEFLPAESADEARKRAASGFRKTTFFGWDTAGPRAIKNQTGWRAWAQPVDGLETFNAKKVLPSMIGPAMSAYFIYDGYRENGLRGAFEAGVMDITMSTAIASYQFGTVATTQLVSGTGDDAGKLIRQHGTKYISKFGMGTAAAIGVIGMQGWEYGKEHFGLGGAIAGMAGMSKLGHIALTGGKGGGWKQRLLAVGGMAAFAGVNWGVSQGKKMLLQQQEKFEMGRAITKSKIGIDTAGSTAAFYTRNANTMRARSVMAMRNSHLNARSALGMEATYMHMDRNYFSRYR